MEQASAPRPDRSACQIPPLRSTLLRSIWNRRRRVFLFAAVAAVIEVNGIAYRHAWLMTHFSDAGHEAIFAASPDLWKRSVAGFLRSIQTR
jgi:hypothetical protein